MSFMLFEIWSEDEDGHQELIETTASEKEAYDIANQCLSEGYVSATIYQETESGDTVLVERLEVD